jgi:hypothetical protein
VDGATGEATEVCPDCVVKDAEKTRMARSYEATIRNLRADLEAAQPDDRAVRAVLDYWADRVQQEGWWSRRPLFKPGDQRWQAVRGRLKDGRTVQDCELAVEGALLGDRKRIRREWIDATSVFRNNENFERHLERAVDRDQENVVVRRALPAELAALDADQLAYLAERCGCGHLRLFHVGCAETAGRQVCARCGCGDYHDEGETVEQWAARTVRE